MAVARIWPRPAVRPISDAAFKRFVRPMPEIDAIWSCARVASEGLYIGVRLAGAWAIYDYNGELCLFYAVAEWARGRGFGTALASAAARWARDYGERVLAGVYETNAASLRVLERAGFVRIEDTDPGVVWFVAGA